MIIQFGICVKDDTFCLIGVMVQNNNKKNFISKQNAEYSSMMGAVEPV